MNKSNLVFLDTETTGKGPNDRLCQVAYSFNGEEFDALFKPPIPIQIEAMAITHITNKIVEDKEPFIGSEFQKKLIDILSKENILVAHNAQFDVDMLRKENIEVGSAIDTLKIAHHLDKEAKIPKHGLQYLRYFLDLNIQDVVPHSALGDVRVLEKLFERLFQKMLVEFKEESAVIDEMLRISALPILMKKFSFGKYNGSMVADVAKTDLGYLRWLLNEKNKAKEQEGINDENWIHTLEYYLQK
ncbi:MAG: exonuclease domain-containing protein [Parcubacteria group bacterium]|jgi:DNA polymerase III epsilon subunit-like protein